MIVMLVLLPASMIAIRNFDLDTKKKSWPCNTQQNNPSIYGRVREFGSCRLEAHKQQRELNFLCMWPRDVGSSPAAKR